MGKKMYVVFNGRRPGMYYTWEESRQQVDGFSMARFKGYKSTSEAYTQWTAFCEYVAQHYEAVTDYQTGTLNTERPIIASYSNLSIGRSPPPSHYCAKCVGICTLADGVEETTRSIEALLRIIFCCLLLILAIQLIAWS